MLAKQVEKLLIFHTIFPLCQIGFYKVAKTVRYNGNKIRHITPLIQQIGVLYDFQFAK